ncbi:MAG: glutathione S-transferase, partial [Gammaproteobacteria bacterium]
LAQLCGFDPTSTRIAQAHAPRVVAWTQRLDDLSGWRADDAQWLSRDAALPALRPLLDEIGASYVPFLFANAATRTAGRDSVECEVRGGVWRQKVFAYQVKCLNWLREQAASLGVRDRAWLAEALAGSGCEALL